MIIIYAILLASAGLSSLSEASAIKGHAQQPVRALEEGRSIKPAQLSNHLDKAAKSAPVTPVLESSKKIYNDESIRRLAAPAVVEQPAVVVVPAAAVASPVAVPAKQEVPVVAAAAAPVVVPAKVVEQPATVVSQPVAPVVVAQSPVVEKQPEPVQSVVVKESPVVVSQIEAKSASEQKAVEPKAVEPKSAPVEPKSAPVEVKPVEAPAAAVKPVDELPAQSERSAQPIVVAVAEQVVASPVQPEVPAASVAEPKPTSSEPIKESALEARKDEVVPAVAPVPVAAPVPAPVSAPLPAPVPAVEPLHIEVPAPDPGLVLSEPIDSTTKLLIDLDEHVQKFLPAEDQQQQPAQPHKDQIPVAGVDFSPAAEQQASGKSSAPLVPYSGLDEPIVPPLPASLEGVEKASASATGSSVAAAGTVVAAAAAGSSATRQGNNSPQNQQQVITQLMDQLDSLQNRIQDTINQLVARRRYVMSALLRPMGTYVRRVRTNLERLQTRVNQLQAAAVSVGGGNGPSRPGGFVDAAAIETIRRRIDDISKRISDIVNRIRFSLTPTSAPLNSNGRRRK